MKLSWTRRCVHPRHRFATSQGGIDERWVVHVELRHDGVVGLGEAAPSRLYGQTLESTEAALAEMATALGSDPFEIEPIVARLIAGHDQQRAAVSAVDAALHDWVGKRLNIPVWRLLGQRRPEVRTTMTIGVADLDETAVKVDEALAAGFRALKVKVGVAQDDEVLALIRSRFDGPLYLDANEAWEPGQAEQRIRALAQYRPAVVEQPLRRADWRSFAALRDLRIAPIIADESCERPADVLRLCGCVDGVNIKFTKCGGIREALRMIALARACQMQIMLGCFVSTSLATAPALAVAGLVDHVDLDAHLLLADDPYDGLELRAGHVCATEAPGLGVQPRAAF